MESAQSVRKKQCVQWTEKETWALIKLWEDHLDAPRSHKHNGGVYQAIAESLTDAGIPRTRAQVHSKIDNLTQTFRKIERELTAGSSPSTWPYYSEIKRFISCLPINDPSLMEESCCNSSSDTVKKHRQLGHLGASGFRVVAAGVMKAIIAPTVQRLYSLHGKKGKRAFLMTRLCAFDMHVDKHSTTATKAERPQQINRYLADMLKVLKQ
ncbi:hypothetical protein HPB52_004501 [Rhipicephalus sanguineus]|uniref:Myb/SANT-like DNA-binding domain-containing protein n=1 Tax=Rhipicephalus sanguineus TaxID=34632 RepID=A0A9D4T594_RHISA|nr:hypothetical protein HPB52_004501 [Rhipicephalus sanguineus]